KLRLVFRCERKFSSLFFQRSACLFHFFVFAFDLDVLLSKLFCLGGQLLVRLLKFSLSRLKFNSQLLRLAKEIFSPHRGFDRIEDNSERLRKLLQKAQMSWRKRRESCQFDYGLRFAFE